MEFRVQHKKGCLRVSGEMTIHTAAALKADLLAALGRHRGAKQFDLSEVSEFDTAGLQLLLAAQRQAAAESRELRLVQVSSTVHGILTLCQLTALLPASPAELRG